MRIYLKQILYILFILLFSDGFAQNVVYHGSAQEDVAHSIVEYENNFFIVGTTREDFKQGTNYYVLQLHPNGSLKNKIIFGYPHYDTGFDIFVDESGIYVLGQSWDGGYGNNDMFLHKLNFEGKVKWNKFYGFNNNEIGHKLIKTSDGGFALAGHNRSLDDFGDMYLVKTDKDGAIIWENHFGDRWVDHAFSVVENNEGEIVVAGTWGGFFVPNCCDFQNSDADIFIVKTDSQGNKIWEKRYGGNEHDWAKDIIVAPGGGYFVCGSSQGQGAGSFDVFLMKIDEDGNELWFKTYGGTNFEYGESLEINAEQNLYLLGTSASFSADSKPDHYLVKTDLNGDVIWEKTFGNDGSDYSSGLVCTSDLGCVFTGSTNGGTIGNKDVVFYKVDKNGEAMVVSAIPPLNDSIEQISVFPNPVENVFNIQIDTKVNTNFQVRLYNTTGQLVYEKSVESNTKSLHQPQLPSGLYFYTIHNKNKIVNKGKLIFTRLP